MQPKQQNDSPKVGPSTSDRRFTVEKVNEYESLVFDPNDPRKSVVSVNPDPPNILPPPPPSPKSAGNTDTNALPPNSTAHLNTPIDMRQNTSINSFSGSSLISSFKPPPAAAPDNLAMSKRNSKSSMAYNPQLTISNRSMSRNFRMRSKSMGNALHARSVRIEEPNVRIKPSFLKISLLN